MNTANILKHHTLVVAPTAFSAGRPLAAAPRAGLWRLAIAGGPHPVDRRARPFPALAALRRRRTAHEHAPGRHIAGRRAGLDLAAQPLADADLVRRAGGGDRWPRAVDQQPPRAQRLSPGLWLPGVPDHFRRRSGSFPDRRAGPPAAYDDRPLHAGPARACSLPFPPTRSAARPAMPSTSSMACWSSWRSRSSCSAPWHSPSLPASATSKRWPRLRSPSPPRCWCWPGRGIRAAASRVSAPPSRATCSRWACRSSNG